MESDVPQRLSVTRSLGEQTLKRSSTFDFRSPTPYYSHAQGPSADPLRPASPSLDSLDAQGKLHRRIWLLESLNSRLTNDIETLKKSHEDDLNAERAVAAGLRDRIGRLEERVRSARKSMEEGRKREEELMRDMEGTEKFYQGEVERLMKAWMSEKEALATERLKTKEWSEKLERTDQENFEKEKSGPVSRYKKQRSPLGEVSQNTQSESYLSNSNPSSWPSNTSRLNISSGELPLSPMGEKEGIQPTSQQFQDLQDQYDKLQKDFGNLAQKHEEDLKHWKEWKRVEKEKVARKRAKKAQRDSGGPFRYSIDSIKTPFDTENDSHISLEGKHTDPQHMSTAIVENMTTRHADELSKSDTIPKSIDIMPLTKAVVKKDMVERSFESTTEGDNHSTEKSVILPELEKLDKPPYIDIPPHKYKYHAPLSEVHPIKSEAHVQTGAVSGSSKKPIHTNAETFTAKTTPLATRFKEMAELTPEERIAQRRLLSRLPTSERRELYAGYKGHGRYLPPEEITKRVQDEYEIDREKNDGVGYQYHEVKRRKVDRRQMHGGDCECCKDYYHAIGPIPRYNTGPIWKSPSPSPSPPSSLHTSRQKPLLTTDDHLNEIHPDLLKEEFVGMETSKKEKNQKEREIQEHQNKISRHREVWIRPPTPPGYWNIGFPTTQDVQEQNKKADEMVREKEAKLRAEVG
ncbi:hypothetical protein M231_06196 [Tremella mesenterica]|uniref:DNA endonuclease activator Ctp1 C-terminal domain-containing protein n=1 Tax=Tremella mesenterica TaxID=5217 RepID=A0A4Q1BDY8_TREME|nr:hypothetical protein M231_06196 [Tremella mesenterica]